MRLREDYQLTAQFAECVDMIVSGASVTACLERFPEQAVQLEPLLASLVGVRTLAAPPSRSVEAAIPARAAFMAEANRVRRGCATAAPIPWWRKLIPVLLPGGSGPFSARPVALFAILLILFISGIVISGSVTLAAGALPGDPLYGVKTASEDVRLFFASNEGIRTELRKEFGQRRIDEAQAVVEVRRPVDNLRLQGTIESFDPQQWVVSGLRVMLVASSQVDGTPTVGAIVEGRVRAPGDGRLLLIYAEVRPPDPGTVTQGPDTPAAAAATLEVAATSTQTPTLTPTLTLSPTYTPSQVAPRLPVVFPGLEPFEPTDAPTATPTWTPTVTRTPTRTPTITRTPTRTPSPTATATWTLPPPRPKPVSSRISGLITAINGSVWTIGGTEVEVNGGTQIAGNAVVGARVDCEVLIRTSGLPLALNITVLAPPEATPVPVEFQDYIVAIASPWYTVGSHRVKVTEDSQVDSGLVVGDRVSVRALEQTSGELWATSIQRVPATEVQIDGVIDAYSSSSITIDGQAMTITPATQFIGTPVVGWLAQARALQFSDGSLTALVVAVFEPVLPTSTLTPTLEPTATPTLEPTATPTVAPLEPTATPTVMSLESPTATTEPASTATSEPAATPTP